MKKRLSLTANAPGNVTPISDVTRGGSSLIGSNGEFNANNKKELMDIISGVIDLANNGQRIVPDSDADRRAESVKSHREMINAAFDDKEELAVLGKTLAEELTITSNRDGFMRRLLKYQTLEQGQIPSVRLLTKNVTASIATGPSQTNTQYVRDNDFYPAEFYINARPFIEQKDIARSTGDILEDKYVDALEAIMVQEDLTWKRMSDDLIGLDNPHVNISGALTPSTFGNLVSFVHRWGVHAMYALIASDIWTDIVSNDAWATTIDPVSQHELLLTGQLGTIHGLTMISDHYRHPQHHVLNAGDIYIVGAPEQHGQYTDRGGVESQPIDATVERVPGRGWHLTETMSMIVANSRSIARGKRSS